MLSGVLLLSFLLALPNAEQLRAQAQHTVLLPLLTVRRVPRIAFSSDRDGNSEIYVMNYDGTSQRNLTGSPMEEYSPSWSPDGGQIAFASNRAGTPSDIFVMRSDGSNVQRLTTSGGNGDPAWSPDGKYIAFASSQESQRPLEIFIMDADGGNQRRLTDNYEDESGLTWSPSGLLTYSSDQGRSTPYNIYTLTPGEYNPIRMTNESADDKALAPSWLPDGTRLSFWRQGVSTRGFYSIGADGSNVAQLPNTFDSTYPFPIAWSPDGLFRLLTIEPDVTNPNQIFQVFRQRADGSETTQLTNIGTNSRPVWEPLGRAPSSAAP